MPPRKIYRKSLTKYFSASFAYRPSNEIGRKRWGPCGVTSRVHSADHDSTATVFPVPSINDEQLEAATANPFGLSFSVCSDALTIHLQPIGYRNQKPRNSFA